MERMGYKVLKILGNSSNIKVTFPEDLELVNKFNTRTGTGFDLHTYQPGTGFVLGGYFIECDYSINAHSDGDVLLHSIACLLYTSPSPRDGLLSRMPSSA